MKKNKRIKKYGGVIWDTDPDHTPKSRFLLVSSLWTMLNCHCKTNKCSIYSKSSLTLCVNGNSSFILFLLCFSSTIIMNLIFLRRLIRFVISAWLLDLFIIGGRGDERWFFLRLIIIGRFLRFLISPYCWSRDWYYNSVILKIIFSKLFPLEATELVTDTKRIIRPNSNLVISMQLWRFRQLDIKITVFRLSINSHLKQDDCDYDQK